MNIYVGNLAYSVTEDELRQLFGQYGAVRKAIVMMDRDTGRSKGFGFVEMEQQADAEKAIEELDGRPVNGRNIRVNQARPKEDRPKGARPKRW